MEITQRTAGDVTVITLAGEIDLYNAASLKSAVAALTAEQKYRIVLNMKRVSYMDSTAIGVLVSALLLIKKNNGDLKLAQTEPSIQKVLRLTHLDDFIELWDSEEEAIASFQKS